MTKEQIRAIHDKLVAEFWGDIDPSWFEFIDLNGDLSDYESGHLEFQKVLQAE